MAAGDEIQRDRGDWSLLGAVAQLTARAKQSRTTKQGAHHR